MDITWLLQSSIQCSSQCVHFLFLLLFLSFYLLTAHSHSHTHTMHGLAYDHWLCRWITQFATITDNPIWTLYDDLKKWQTREIFGLIRKKVVLEWVKYFIQFLCTMFIFISKNGNLNNSLNESTVFHWFEWIVYRCSCGKKNQSQMNERKIKSMSSSRISDPLKKPTKCQLLS